MTTVSAFLTVASGGGGLARATGTTQQSCFAVIDVDERLDCAGEHLLLRGQAHATRCTVELWLLWPQDQSCFEQMLGLRDRGVGSRG